MDNFVLSDHVKEDGSLNADGPGLATLAGPDHTEIKCFDDIKDFSSLVKFSADTKSKLGEKVKLLERAIIKPADGASDEDRANYRNTILTELGGEIPKSGAEYVFVRPVMPKGLPYRDDIESSFREFFAENHVPKGMAAKLYDKFMADTIAEHNERIKTQKQQHDLDVEAVNKDWPGDALTVNTRNAYNAMIVYGSDDTTAEDGTVVKGLKTLLKESGVYGSPGDFDKWLSLGITPDQIRLWSKIGKDMQSGTILPGEGGQTGEEKPEEAFADACSSKSSMAKA